MISRLRALPLSIVPIAAATRHIGACVLGLTRTLSAPLIVFFLAACQGTGPNYLQHGIGAQLPAADIVSASRQQHAYFNELCGQAGLSSPCTLPIYDRGWTLVVRQGMNDIDRRCDAYLQWLDDRKRSRGPLLSQVSAVGTTTQAVIGFVDPGAIKAINLVGQAFGLLTKSIENYHSRLLLEVDSSTVNSVVINARHRFRAKTRGQNFDNRPDAEYVLREYLRLCLPFAIETNINDYTTLGSSGIAVTDDNSINQTPFAGQSIGDPGAGVERTFRAKDRLRADPPVAEFIPGAASPWERQLQPPDLARIQGYLCIENPAANFGDRTRLGIELWTEVRAGATGDGILDGREGALLLQDVSTDGACAVDRHRNVYERLALSSPAAEAQFVAKLANALGRPDAFAGQGTLALARPLIGEYKTSNPQYQRKGLAIDEVTPLMFRRINQIVVN